MRICFFTTYTRAGASSRYRSYQYQALLKEQGHTADIFPLMGSPYLEHLYKGRDFPLVSTVSAVTRRIRDVFRASRYDVVVIERELLKWLPGWLEQILFRLNPTVVVDYDDAVYVNYAGVPWLRSKIPWLMARSRAVVAGNQYIGEFARQFNPHTVIVPTVVDLARYQPKKVYRRSGPFIEIAWIGTPITARLLLPLVPVWRQLTERFPQIRFKLIGAGKQVRLPGVRYHVLPWSEQTEAQELAEADIGIMPLEDVPFHRGKCALKIIQYMAAGLPVVASPVGANNDVIQQGVTGFLPRSNEEWFEALADLTQNSDLRERMGQTGRERVRKKYSLEAAFPVLEATYRAASC